MNTSMIEIKAKVGDMGNVDILDGHFYGKGDMNWILQQRADGEPFYVIGYFGNQEEARQAWDQLTSEYGFLKEEVLEIRVLNEADWKYEYKKYLKPWRYERLHWVPTWEKENYKIGSGDKVLWVDAGMAFGTGAHETTQLCGIQLVRIADRYGGEVGGKRVIDAGCGSGILSLSAKVLGFGEVVGFDIDKESIRVSEDNRELNGVKGGVEFYHGGIEEYVKEGGADVVVANILAPVLCEYSRELVKGVRKKGVLVLSGILGSEAAGVEQCYEGVIKEEWGGVFSVERDRLGEWAAIVFFRH